jgi:hypothetical protein
MGAARAAVFVSLVLAAAGCGGTSTPSATTAPSAGDWFEDRAAAAGIDFVHVNGMSGQFSMPEILGPGVALFDFDNDDDLDAYLVQGGGFASRGANDRLYRNDLTIAADGARTLRFTDVTTASRIEARGYGMGVAAGDFDNDGWVDLYLTKFDAPNQLLRNNGDGTFTDVSKRQRHGSALVERLGVLRRFRPRRVAGSVRRQLSPIPPRRQHEVLEPNGRSRLLHA